MRISSFFRCLKNTIIKNSYGYNCPNCSTKETDVNSCRANFFYDEKFKEYKYFIKCKYCSLTTPGYKTIKEAESLFEQYWINKELETLKL